MTWFIGAHRTPLEPAYMTGGAMGSFSEQVGDDHRLVAGWTQSTRTYPPAKASTIGAVLVTEVAVVTGGALIDGAVPRRAGWDRWKRSRVPSPPCHLAASWLAKALSANRWERSPTHRAARRRLANVTQREFKQHDQPALPACRGA